jgi:hypothetical protein
MSDFTKKHHKQLQYMFNKSAPINEIHNAINNLSQTQIQNLIQYELDNCNERKFCPSILELASKYNYTQVVKLLCELGFREVYKNDFIDISIMADFNVNKIDTFCTRYFIINSNTELLDYYKDKNYIIDRWIYSTAIDNKSIIVLEWCKNNNIKLTNKRDFLLDAIVKNDIELLNYLRDNNLIYNYSQYQINNIYDSKIFCFGGKNLFQYKNHKHYAYLNDNILNWLWSNGYKWSKYHATKYNDAFMLSKFV